MNITSVTNKIILLAKALKMFKGVICLKIQKKKMSTSCNRFTIYYNTLVS